MADPLTPSIPEEATTVRYFLHPFVSHRDSHATHFFGRCYMQIPLLFGAILQTIETIVKIALSILLFFPTRITGKSRIWYDKHVFLPMLHSLIYLSFSYTFCIINLFKKNILHSVNDTFEMFPPMASESTGYHSDPTSGTVYY